MAVCLIVLSACSKNENTVTSKQSSASSGSYPIRWTHFVSLGSLEQLKDMDTFLAQPVRTVNGIETIGMVNEAGSEVTVSTPKDWLRFSAQGYGPKSTYDIKAEGWYKRTCLPRMYLKNAVPARISYLHDFDFSQDPLKQLPATLGFDGTFGERCQEIEQEVKRGKTWHDLSPTLQFEAEDPYRVVIEDDEELTTIDLLAWGDFDGNGVEDFLLDVANRFKTGTMCCYRMVTLTRLEPGGPLVVVKEE
jgi:hypothetical protein